MQDYIDEHIKDSITSSDIARAAGYSQFHAARIFKEETGLSPFEYIRQRRLIKSAYALRNENARVLDIALDFVFDSHEGFTRAFTNAFGITPKKYAVFPIPKGWLIPYRYLDRHKLKSEEIKMEKKTAIIFTQIIERPERKMILRRSKKATNYFEYCEEVGCYTPEKPDPWSILSDIKEALYEPVGVWLPKSMCPDGTGLYAHAVEVPADYSGKIPESFDIINLTPCKYLIFQGEPYDDENYQEAIGAFWNNIENFNPQVYGYAWDDEIAPKIQLAPMGWRGYIEGRPIKEKNHNLL
ncbi:AraC family transcriptional regulator [bacterium]|nr:AraC family transcriptional regulator [bacterium]